LIKSKILVSRLRRHIRYPPEVILEVAAFSLGGFRLEIVERHHRGHFFGGGASDELIDGDGVALGQFLDLLMNGVRQTNGSKNRRGRWPARSVPLRGESP
jgi:hypothetical protein